MANRFVTYGAVSTLLVVSAVYSAWINRTNFYGACVHLTRSGSSLMILLNFAVFFSLLVGRIAQQAFFGPLRAIEVEHLYERSWFTVTETCLAMTLFRDQFDVKYLVLFGFLLIVKIFHWLAIDRVDFMEQQPNPPTIYQHLRMSTIMLIMICIDVGITLYTWNYTQRRGASMMLIFGFENAVMIFSISLAIIKYCLHTIDLRSEHPWERKSMFIFYSELIMDFCKLLTYLAFFVIIMHYYGLPLHILRDLYLILRSFVQRIKDLVQYTRATRNMNDRYPTATEADLQNTDRTCIICREEMVGSDAPAPAAPAAVAPGQAPPPNQRKVAKKLACGHIFHLNCLRSWLERQQSCPTCRRSVLETPAVPPGGVGPGVGPAAPAAGANENPQAAVLHALQALLQQQQQQLHPPAHARSTSNISRDFPLVGSTTDASNSGASNAATASTSNPDPGKSGVSILDQSIGKVEDVLLNKPLFASVHNGEILYPFMLTPLPDESVPTQDPLTSLTDAQLASLEGRTRDRVIARLKEIRLIQNQLSGLSVRLAQVIDLMPEVPKSEKKTDAEEGKEENFGKGKQVA